MLLNAKMVLCDWPRYDSTGGLWVCNDGETPHTLAKYA